MDKHLDAGTIELYQAELSDIPAPLLDQAVSQHIQNFPLVPTHLRPAPGCPAAGWQCKFRQPQPPGEDFLAREAFQLENDYFQQGTFDLHAWEALADQFERMGCPYRAEELRRKVQHIQEA